MQSRRDQVQAYFFVVGRLFSALIHGKPDILEPPTRRFTTGVTLGAMAAVLLVGIFALIGILKPGGGTQAWRSPGTVIVDKDTGARFLFLDGKLRPVLNFSSAKLAASAGGGGRGSAPVQQVSANALSGVPVGTPIGIPGAPDGIPQPNRLDKGAWTTCVSSANPQTVTLLLGQQPGAPMTEEQGLLVSTSDGAKYLLWQGNRYRLTNATATAALGFNGITPVAVPANWLNPIPSGRDITLPAIGGTGSRGPSIGGNRSVVGQIYEVRNPALGTDQVFVVRPDGLAPLNRTTEALLLASPGTKAAYPGTDVAPIVVAPGALAGVPTSANTADLAGYPSPLPSLLNGSLPPDTQPCVRYDLAGTKAATFLTMPTPAVNALAAKTGQHVAGTTVDQVAIPAGSGVLARDLPTPGANPGAEFLVTDFGVKFPLAAGASAALGYAAGSGVDVPNRLLALLPTGPVLSSTAALAEGTP